MPKCPNQQLMGADWCSAWGYQGCLNCLWKRQDDLKNAKGSNEPLAWVQVLSGLTGRWTEGVVDKMPSSIVPEVTGIRALPKVCYGM